MENNFSFTVLIPPVCILLCAYFTRRVILSLIMGIILATLIAKNFNIGASFQLAYNCILTTLEFNKFFSYDQFWETYYLFICIFLLVLGIFVVLMQHSGGAHAYSSFIKKYIHNKKSVETSSIILSICLFIDDYFNSLTVGSIMHPLADLNKIPRVKLAFLVHSLSSPLVILCPISSWVAAILGFLYKNGIAEKATASTFVLANPLVTYLKIIPFIFYSVILIIVIWYITQTRISFGSMKKYEDIAEKTGDLFGGKEPEKYLLDPKPEKNHVHFTLLDFFFPILTLIICILGCMLYSGKWICFGGCNNFITAFQNSSAVTALFLGGNCALIICIFFLVMRKKIKLQELPQIFVEGINLMISPVITLLLAWTFGYILTSQLHTGEYLAQLLISSVDITMLPALLFVIAASIACIIGTSWGTAAMLFPIAIPMVPAILGLHHIPTLEEIPILIPALGAILSGCVAGNHISPIADTTIMSATSTRTPIMDHVRTQLPYAIPIILTTALSFVLSAKLIPYGLTIAAIVPLIAGAMVAMAIMHGLHILSR